MKPLFWILVLAIVGFFVAFFAMAPRIGGRSTPQKSFRTMGIIFLSAGLGLILLAIAAEVWIASVIGGVFALIGLGFFTPSFRKLLLRRKLRENGMQCEAVVVGYEEDPRYGVRISISVPFYSRRKGYYPNCYRCESDVKSFSFFFPPAWKTPEKMPGLRVKVYYDPADYSRYIVDLKSVKEAWRAKCASET